MDNTIPRRIYDFLKDFPPFNLLDKEVLLLLCERVLVQYRRPEEVVFQQGDAPGSHIYVVREGAVQLLREVNGETILVEQCDEGDLFGLRPLLAGRTIRVPGGEDDLPTLRQVLADAGVEADVRTAPATLEETLVELSR